MAKFKGKDLYLNSDDQIYFGDSAEAASGMIRLVNYR